MAGRYFEDNNEAVRIDGPNMERGVAAHALDPEAAARLWDLGVSMLQNRSAASAG